MCLADNLDRPGPRPIALAAAGRCAERPVEAGIDVSRVRGPLPQQAEQQPGQQGVASGRGHTLSIDSASTALIRRVGEAVAAGRSGVRAAPGHANMCSMKSNRGPARP